MIDSAVVYLDLREYTPVLWSVVCKKVTEDSPAHRKLNIISQHQRLPTFNHCRQESQRNGK